MNPAAVDLIRIIPRDPQFGNGRAPWHVWVMAPYRLTQTVEALPSTVPFVAPEAQERSRGRPFRARIGANESVFGPSPRAVQAMQEAAIEAWKYCDPENHDLKQALA